MTIKELLKRLNLPLKKVYFTSSNSYVSSLSIETQKRLRIIEPDAYYIFNNQPFILFFDLGKESDQIREEKIHKQLWCFDHTPLIFIIKNNQIEIYNAFSYNKNTNRLKRIEVSNNEIEKEFSFWNLESGTTWKWLEKKEYGQSVNKNRVNQKLFDNIKQIREKLSSDGLKEELANILILRLIFIRYLIDRNVKIDKEYISGRTILQKRKSLSNIILYPKKLNLFFNYLNLRFNGVLFKDTNINLTKRQAVSLSLVFDGRENFEDNLFDNDIEFFFDVFDFSIIPVEVISGIYESIIDPEKKLETSAIYTPSFLVEYILTETVDKSLEKDEGTECKIFDPACGSGIFLVQALRRMIDKEISVLKLKGKISNKKLGERICKITKQNLFGIDINENALKVASFSIYVALLDYLNPKDINNYKFPNLIGENLFHADFFNLDHSYNDKFSSKNIEFDFILGNPPWKSVKTKHFVNWIKEKNKSIGRYEIAQGYLLRSKDFMSAKTVSSFVVTSTIFYNVSKKTREFKNEFLNDFCLDVFFDLSAVRRFVFSGEKIKVGKDGKKKLERYSNPASILIYRISQNNQPRHNNVKHYSVKSNIFLKYFRTIVIEKFDQKEIAQKHFIENDWMFKVALYGNTLDFVFLKKLEEIDTKIFNLIDNKIIFKGAGILKGNPKKYKPFNPIIGRELVENNQIQEYFTCPDQTSKITKEFSYLKSGRKKELFEGNQILIKEQAKNETDIAISFTCSNYVFKKGIFGISSSTNYAFIKVVFGYLITKLYTYYIYNTSSSWGIATRPQIRLDEEYLSFPYKKLKDKDRIHLVSLINDFLKPFQEYYRQPIHSESLPIDSKILKQVNNLINKQYGLTEIENDLIDYVLEVSRYQFQESKQNKVIKFRDKEKDLRKYVEVFIKQFDGIYPDEYLKIEIYPLNYFIAINFIFSKRKVSPKLKIEFIYDKTKEKEVLTILSKKLSIWKITNSNNPNNNLYIQKDVKGFEKDSFYIIKPNEYKCWHRSMAWYDVAEIKEKLETAELHYLTKLSSVS